MQTYATFDKDAEGLLSRLNFIKAVAEADLPIVTNNKRVSYYNVPAAFDIETSSFYIDGEKKACMYVWQFGILNWVTYGRTWEEFDKFMSVLSTVLGLDSELRLVVYIHNFAYEFQWMRKRVHWDKLFFLDKRKPVYGISGGYEYRCSLKLSGKSLAKVASDLQKYPCQKKVGDLDYSLVRTYKTPLAQKEWGYCEADIRVLLAYIQEKIEADGDITQIPLTNTGYVRNYCRKACFKRWKRYKGLMSELILTPEEYSQLKQVFAGGFTHANAHYSRRIVKHVGSFRLYELVSIRYDFGEVPNVESKTCRGNKLGRGAVHVSEHILLHVRRYIEQFDAEGGHGSPNFRIEVNQRGGRSKG